jgi:3-oxoacyl-[acyl-carrier-protein] synthase-3
MQVLAKGLPVTAPEIHIVSVGTTLPGPPIDNARLARQFGTNAQWEEWVNSFIATPVRHLSVDLDTGKITHSLADLATTAARRAMRAAALEPADVDVIVMASSTPDKLLPATVNVVADQLGINDVPSFQLQSGCCGAFQAMSVAAALLRDGSCRTALVLGGDSCTKHIDLHIDIKQLPPAAMVSLVLFGDGAGAVVLSATPTEDSAVLRHVFTRLTGLNRPAGHVVEWYGRPEHQPAGPAAAEDYKAIERFVPAMSTEILDEVLVSVGWKPDDVDFLLPPQLSGRMTARITQDLGLRGATEITCVKQTANTGNATPFFQLERLLPVLAPGDRAVGIAVESSKWIKSGFAVEKV